MASLISLNMFRHLMPAELNSHNIQDKKSTCNHVHIFCDKPSTTCRRRQIELCILPIGEDIRIYYRKLEISNKNFKGFRNVRKSIETNGDISVP